MIPNVGVDGSESWDGKIELILAVAVVRNRPAQSKTVANRSEDSCVLKRLRGYSPKILMGERREDSGDLLRDTLDLLILKTLARGERHGYGIAEYIHETTEDVLRVEEGALYPALHRLELRGLLASEWGASENNRRAKYYRLTAAGRKQLAEETEHWARMSSAIARILEPA